MPGINTVIFDFDGTLVDGFEAIYECFLQVFRNLKIPPPAPEYIRGEIGFPLEDTMKRLLGEEYEQHLVPALMIYRENARELLPVKTHFRPGVPEAIKRLSELGIRMGIATSKNTGSTLKTLEFLGVECHFQVICGVDDVKNPKPHPEQLNLVLEKLSAGSDESLMVGDTHLDILAAKAAGIKSVAVLDGFGVRSEIISAGPDYLVEDSKRMAEILEAIIKG